MKSNTVWSTNIYNSRRTTLVRISGQITDYFLIPAKQRLSKNLLFNTTYVLRNRKSFPKYRTTNKMQIYFITDLFSVTEYNPRMVLRTVKKHTSLPSVVQSRILLEPQHTLQAFPQLAVSEAVKNQNKEYFPWFRKMHPGMKSGRGACITYITCRFTQMTKSLLGYETENIATDIYLLWFHAGSDIQIKTLQSSLIWNRNIHIQTYGHCRWEYCCALLLISICIFHMFAARNNFNASHPTSWHTDTS
jgi:hypothetical protein